MKHYLIFVLIFCVLPGEVRADDKPKPILPPEAGLPVIDWKDTANYMGQEVIVQGRIVQTRNIGRHCFLNFDADRSFTAIIHQEGLANFPEPPEQTYDQKIVRVRGLISDYKGKTQLEVVKPEQITILDKELPLPPPPKPASAHRFDGTVTVASYNTLNFFDEYDNPYTLDESTPAKPRAQLEHLAKTIHKLDADVLVLEEVENRGYLERFNTAMLKDLGYLEVVLFEGNDKRGINCALLSRFPVGPVESHRHLHFADAEGRPIHFQRDLLRVEIEPPGAPAFDIFAVHLKSKRGSEAPNDQGASPTSDGIRIGEAKATRKILDALIAKDKNALFLVCGDFNDTWDSESLKAIRGMGEGQLTGFVDELPKDARTYNEGEHADMIDFILASPAMSKKFVKNSYKVVPGTIESSGSDHNPVVARFKLK
jgi:endonuclease/exonuclease/phosphatase family metal-dependent hydrolase